MLKGGKKAGYPQAVCNLCNYLEIHLKVGFAASPVCFQHSNIFVTEFPCILEVSELGVAVGNPSISLCIFRSDIAKTIEWYLMASRYLPCLAFAMRHLNKSNAS
ncbi:hypothetical protein V6N13_144163 [Hibiscus sabdariffa]